MPTQDHQARITPLMGEAFLGQEKYQPALDSIFAGLGISAGSGVMPELNFQPGSGNLADVIPGWTYPMYEKQEK